ncbi:1-acyl-sn-glycerol-3-phosphate acyltransferase [Mycolicibacterium helvum]|uniref:Phospholipid/glycerol acyltransferase domain-containing protein n=1 Tax=Mycolicibacterium helvum TaxID=1534349 RepID=A0A7I7T6T5_9MYCO|nr:1-acyl-sn-glycerol-3-phosphate acyltransferase [Mycolicibacterium helvum]BBY64189.1 hypothetical protein MHEL_24320 [Mycolicibacterium helvum]
MEPVFRTLEIVAPMAVRAAGTKITFEGAENIPTRGGAVIAINHTSYVDCLPAALGTRRRKRRIRSFALKGFTSGAARMALEAQLVYPHPRGEYWVPEVLGGGAPSVDEANRRDEAELAERARRTGEHH